jgi:hypothetical protein
MIDLKNGFGPAEAARRVPCLRKDRPVAPSTIIRWIVDGVIGADGQVVRLSAVRLGHRWVTDDLALRRFAERLTPARPGQTGQRTPSARQHACDRAAQQLRELGFGVASSEDDPNGDDTDDGLQSRPQPESTSSTPASNAD